MSKHTIPTELNIAPRGKSWLHGQLIDGEHGHPTRQSMESAERAQAIQCTCPSGDGSLHWPCPAHPPAAVPGGWQELAARVMDALADAQDRTNAKYPEHVKCYPTWETRPRHLRWLAEMFRTGKPIGNGAGQPDVLAALAATPAAGELAPLQVGLQEPALVVLPEEIPASNTLWMFLTKGMTQSAIAGMPERDRKVLTERAQENWAAIRAEVGATVPVVLPEPASLIAEKLLALARIVNTAVEDWGESSEDNSMDVKFHSDVVTEMDAILDYFDSLPDGPDENVIESGPAKAARILRALLAGVSAPAAQVVASIYVTADGQRECDDWKVPLPIGRNLLYTAPQAQADARDAVRRDLDAQELQGIALQAAWRGGLKQNAPAYLPRSPVSAAVFKAHDWVIEAMRDAIKAAQAAQQGGKQ